MNILVKILLIVATLANSSASYAWAAAWDVACDEAKDPRCQNGEPVAESGPRAHCNRSVLVTCRDSHRAGETESLPSPCEERSAVDCSTAEAAPCPSGHHEREHDAHHHHRCVCPSVTAAWLIDDQESLLKPPVGRAIRHGFLWQAPLESPVFLLDRPPIA